MKKTICTIGLLWAAAENGAFNYRQGFEFEGGRRCV